MNEIKKMKKLLEQLKLEFAHQAIVEGLPITSEHTNRFAEIAYRLCQENAPSPIQERTAEEFFDEYTGGNRYIGTWTFKALMEFTEAYHASQSRSLQEDSLPVLISKVIDKSLPSDGIGTDREKLRMK